MNETDPHLAVGAYVLHALPREEEAAFEDHLAGCPDCRAEVDELTRRAAQLATAVAPVTPPPRLRARVLQQIATVRQDHVVAAERRASAERARRRRLRQRVFRLALAPTAAAALGLGGVAAWQYTVAEHARDQAAQVRTGAAGVADVLAAPDATIRSAKLADGASASVVSSRTQGQSAFIASGLPQLPDHRVYELWYAKAGEFHPAGLLPGSGGRQAHVLAGGIEGASAVAITVEPDGGSPRPTTEPLSVVRLPA